MLIRHVTILILSTILSSCCTKKDCDNEYFPQIIIKYQGFTDDELDEKQVMIAEKESFSVIDSVETNYPKDEIEIDKWVLNSAFDEKLEIKDYNFILKLKDRCDTLYNICYERYSEQIKCNKCFPFGNGDATVTNYRDLNFTYKDSLYMDGDTIIIVNPFGN